MVVNGCNTGYRLLIHTFFKRKSMTKTR